MGDGERAARYGELDRRLPAEGQGSRRGLGRGSTPGNGAGRARPATPAAEQPQVREIDLSMEWASLSESGAPAATATAEGIAEEIEFYLQAGLVNEATAAIGRLGASSPRSIPHSPISTNVWRPCFRAPLPSGETPSPHRGSSSAGCGSSRPSLQSGEPLDSSAASHPDRAESEPRRQSQPGWCWMSWFHGRFPVPLHRDSNFRWKNRRGQRHRSPDARRPPRDRGPNRRSLAGEIALPAPSTAPGGISRRYFCRV